MQWTRWMVRRIERRWPLAIAHTVSMRITDCKWNLIALFLCNRLIVRQRLWCLCAWNCMENPFHLLNDYCYHLYKQGQWGVVLLCVASINTFCCCCCCWSSCRCRVGNFHFFLNSTSLSRRHAIFCDGRWGRSFSEKQIAHDNSHKTMGCWMFTFSSFEARIFGEWQK